MKILGNYRIEILIFSAAVISWGRLIGMGGIWWDDWAWVWLYFGSSSPSEFLEPFQNMGHSLVGYIDYSLLTLLDTASNHAPGLWHTAMFLVHTMNALILYHIVRLVSDNDNIVPSLCISVLYLVSPVITNLYLMVQISYELMVFSYLLSLLFTIFAVTRDKFRIYFYVTSVILAVFPMAGLESFIALEFSRPVLIWYLMKKRRTDNTPFPYRTLLLYSMPLFIAAGILVIKRMTFVPAGGYSGYNKLQVFTLDGMLETLRLLYISLSHVFIKSWRKGLKFIDDLSVTSILSILIFIAGYIVLLLFRRSGKDRLSLTDESNKASLWFLLIYGFIILVFGLLPYNAVGKYPQYGLESRHAVIAKIGYSMFAVSMFYLIGCYNSFVKKILPLVFGLIFSAGLVSSHGTIDSVRGYWEHQRSIWWQMIWRAPDIRPNTFMIIDMPWGEAPGGGSYVLPPGLNMAYAKSRDKKEIFSHYAYELQNAFRTDETNYRGIYDKEVVEFQTYKGLTRIYPKNLIAASYQDDYLYLNDEIAEPVYSNWTDVEFMMSNVKEDRIIYDAAVSDFPYRWILGPELKRDWRYYCQKANALSGRNEQRGIVQLYNGAREKGYDLASIRPQNLLPFIKAFYLTDDLNTGGRLLYEWAASPAGSRERAIKYLISKNPGTGPELNKEIVAGIENAFVDRR